MMVDIQKLQSNEMKLEQSVTPENFRYMIQIHFQSSFLSCRVVLCCTNKMEWKKLDEFCVTLSNILDTVTQCESEIKLEPF